MGKGGWIVAAVLCSVTFSICNGLADTGVIGLFGFGAMDYGVVGLWLLLLNGPLLLTRGARIFLCSRYGT